MKKEAVGQMLFYSVSEKTLRNLAFPEELVDMIISYDYDEYVKFCDNTGLIPICKVELLPNFKAYSDTLEEEEDEKELKDEVLQ